MNEILGPSGIALWQLGALSGASFVGSFITAAFGIGGGALVLGLIAMIVPPAALIPVHGVVQLASNGVRMLMFFRHIRTALIPAFLLGSIAGVLGGVFLAVEIPEGLGLIVVGAFVAWSILGRIPRIMGRSAALNGVISSFLTMFIGATGPFVASFVKAQHLPRHDHVATTSVLMTIQHGLKVIGFAAFGFSLTPWLPLLAGMILCGVAGTWTGKLALNRMSDHGFKRILDIVLLAIALRLVWQGATAMF